MKKVLLKDAVKSMAVLEPFEAKIINLSAQDIESSATLKAEIFMEKADASKLEAGNMIILKSAGVFKVKSTNS
jgi:limonene-1,2-epoxide hydrolase